MDRESGNAETSLEALLSRLEALERRVRVLEEGEGSGTTDAASAASSPDRPPLAPRAVGAGGSVPREPARAPGSTEPEVPGEEPVIRASSDRALQPRQEVPALSTLSLELFGSRLLPLAGRTLVVLGGAYLLRALTEAGHLSRATGIALGLLYALAWSVLADLAGARARWRSATFHGLATALIAYPLLWEVTVSFHYVEPRLTAVLLALVSLVTLGVAWHRNLTGLAWIVVAVALPVLLGLPFAARDLTSFLWATLLLGPLTLWMAYSGVGLPVAITVAAVIDAELTLITTLLVSEPTAPLLGGLTPGGLVFLQLALMLAYLVSFLARALRAERGITPPEILQGAAVVAIGLGGSLATEMATGISTVPLAVASLGLATACYGVSFAVVDRRSDRRRAFIVYTSLALLFGTVSTSVLLEGLPHSIALALLALAAAWLGSWRGRVTLSLHAGVYTLVAAIHAGLIERAGGALLVSELPEELWVDGRIWVVLFAAGVASWFPVAGHRRTWGRWSSLPKMLLLSVLFIGLSGFAVLALARAGTGLFPEPLDPAVLDAIRTGVIATSALLLAELGRSDRFREATWLVLPALMAGGIKLVVSDLPRGRPATLVASFALYGAALLIVPLLVRKRT